METRYKHVVLKKDQIPGIAGTTLKVVELIVEQQAYRWRPEELRFQFPYLILGQVHPALMYYWDHHEELDCDISQRLERIDELCSEVQPLALVAQLRAQGPG